MRNLCISSVHRWKLTIEAANDQPIRPSPSSVTLDVDEQAIYCALEAAGPAAAGTLTKVSEITLMRIIDGVVAVSSGDVEGDQVLIMTATQILCPARKFARQSSSRRTSGFVLSLSSRDAESRVGPCKRRDCPISRRRSQLRVGCRWGF